MKYQVHIIFAIFALLFVSDWAIASLSDLSWKNADSLMNGDLLHRMKRRIPTRRRYCDCSEIEEEDDYLICASNGALYQNACLYKCAKVRWPHLTEVDIADCGTHTFSEFKMEEFRPHY